MRKNVNCISSDECRGKQLVDFILFCVTLLFTSLLLLVHLLSFPLFSSSLLYLFSHLHFTSLNHLLFSPPHFSSLLLLFFITSHSFTPSLALPHLCLPFDLYCTYSWTIPYCTALYRIIPHSTVLHRKTLYSAVQLDVLQSPTLPSHPMQNVQYCMQYLQSTIPFTTFQYSSLLQSTPLHCVLLHSTLLYFSVHYSTLLYSALFLCTVLYCTVTYYKYNVCC